jgi:hypothetical protein
MPLRENIKSYRAKLTAAYAKLILQQIPGPSCDIPGKKDVDSAADTTAKIHNEIEANLKEIERYHSMLLKAFAADSNYPQCVAEKADDPNSTKESKTYLSFKQKLVET